MAGIDVLPRALAAAARAVGRAAEEVEPVPVQEVGHADVTAALSAYVQAWSGHALVTAVDECARSLEDSAGTYATVESLLLPRSLR